ncbi:hypothetical protein SB861_63895, partial [Paraburkholderia sp. SIMBA_049]
MAQCYEAIASMLYCVTQFYDDKTRSVIAAAFGQVAHNSPIAKSLTELRGIVEDLDPSKKELTSSRKLFGLIPFGNKVQDY